MDKELIEEYFIKVKNGRNAYERRQILNDAKQLLNSDEYWELTSKVIDWLTDTIS